MWANPVNQNKVLIVSNITQKKNSFVFDILHKWSTTTVACDLTKTYSSLKKEEHLLQYKYVNQLLNTILYLLGHILHICGQSDGTLLKVSQWLGGHCVPQCPGSVLVAQFTIRKQTIYLLLTLFYIRNKN